MTQFWWVIFPYLCLTVMIVGLIYRYTYGQMGWGSKSSELLEKKVLRWGSLLFHWGIIFVFGGHVMGLLIPISVYHALGVPDETYHMMAQTVGGLAGLAAFLGVVILLIRRTFNTRVRKNSSPSDFVSLILLGIVLGLGEYFTTVYDTIHGSFEYRTTVGPWVRELFYFHPNAQLMAHIPVILQVHIICALTLFAVIPFTRLVHIFSLPVRYPFRAPQQVRSRTRFQKSVR